MPCTVIARGDVADQALDRKKNPVWQGIRTAMLKSLPTNVKLWEQYAELWADGLRLDGTIANATAFYEEHREDMDAGAEASWPERFNEDEVSAIQNAMNLKLRDEPSFYAEYQNEPLSLDAETPLLLTPDQVSQKAIHVKRGVVPIGTSKLTAFIDVQGKLLYYVVVAWKEDFSGHVVDYGCFPEQKRLHFTLREASPVFADVFKNTAPEGQIRQALERLSTQLLTKDWQADDSQTMRISRLMIDSGNWGDIVKQYVSQAGPLKSLIIASKGYGITADRAPMDTWKSSDGDRRGWNWLLKKAEGHVLYDTNSWKTFVAQRFAGSVGEAGNLSIFEGTLNQHKMFSEHATSEYPKPTEGGGRTVHVWQLRPNRENHLYDCLIGCAVAASEQGIRFVGHQEQQGQPAPARKRRKVAASF
jgi:Phage terminase large subunit (GpA)